jgi:hypothetical protein
MSTENNAPQKPRSVPNPALKFWREVGQELVKGSIQSSEEAAKQIIAVSGILEGLYFHAIAFSDLRCRLVGWQIVVYLLPLVLWLASLGSALLVFLPRPYRLNISSSDTCKEAYKEITQSKLVRFQAAAILLALGVLALMLALCIYLIG